MLTKEQLTAIADEVKEDWLDGHGNIRTLCLAALERVQREVASQCAELCETAELGAMIRRTFALQPKEEPRG
jgi:hypothetical protein